eukprot:m.620970 g.620970  ORF g.620970 m.620970 type:complete len:78 (-) comp58210_c0_seq13:529-762(-)
MRNPARAYAWTPRANSCLTRSSVSALPCPYRWISANVGPCTTTYVDHHEGSVSDLFIDWHAGGQQTANPRPRQPLPP